MTPPQFHLNPDTYLDRIRAEVPRYDELQERTIEAIPFPPRRVLELGVGTGETTRRLLERYPDAEVTGLDSQPGDGLRARELGIEVRLARMEDPLPDGPWDLVVSVLSVHHLTEEQKRDLFRRVREQSRAMVMGDVVVAEHAGRSRSRESTCLERGRGPRRVVRRRDRLGGGRPGGDPRRLRVKRARAEAGSFEAASKRAALACCRKRTARAIRSARPATEEETVHVQAALRKARPDRLPDDQPARGPQRDRPGRPPADDRGLGRLPGRRLGGRRDPDRRRARRSAPAPT